MPLRDNIDTNNLNEDYLSFCLLGRLPRQVSVVSLALSGWTLLAHD
jgi:hypothetical protein